MGDPNVDRKLALYSNIRTRAAGHERCSSVARIRISNLEIRTVSDPTNNAPNVANWGADSTASFWPPSMATGHCVQRYTAEIAELCREDGLSASVPLTAASAFSTRFSVNGRWHRNGSIHVRHLPRRRSPENRSRPGVNVTLSTSWTGKHLYYIAAAGMTSRVLAQTRTRCYRHESLHWLPVGRGADRNELFLSSRQTP